MSLTCFKRHPHPSVPSICLALANMTVSSALLVLANFRQSTRIKIMKRIPPSTISRICHHRRWLLSKTIGAVGPLDGFGTEDEDEIDGTDGTDGTDGIDGIELGVVAGAGFVEFCSCTKSDRQTPKSGITLVDPVHSAGTQDPARRTWPELEHAKQLLEPEPEQLEQLESQSWHVEVDRSKYSDWPQFGRHRRPDDKIGRDGGHVSHWSKDTPVQLWQSGWHLRQVPEALKDPGGQTETHWPEEASCWFVQVRQKSAEPRQVPQGDEHAIQLYVC